MTAPHVEPSVARRVAWAASDIAQMTKRNLLRNVRIPQLLVFATIQPIIFTLMFAFVFGGAITIPGVDYVDYLMPGIMIQTVAFGSTQTGVGLAEDLSRGMIDRFRSLPVARSAVLAGRTISDSIRNVFVVFLVLTVGVIIGFRPDAGPVAFALAIGLAVLFGFALSWVSATIGLLVKEAETAQVAGIVWLFPLIFVSSAFVPPDTMPDGLRAFADASPFTLTINAVRALLLRNELIADFWGALAWIAGIVAVFVAISVRRYRRAA